MKLKITRACYEKLCSEILWWKKKVEEISQIQAQKKRLQCK